MRMIPVLLLFVLTACNGLPLIKPPSEAQTAANPSAGCGVAAAVAPGETQVIEVSMGDLLRSYRLHLPPTYDPQQPTSLVLAFHGYTDSAENKEGYSGLNQHADEHNYIVVYPQSIAFTSAEGPITSWNDLSCSASPGPDGPICDTAALEYFDYADPSDCGEVTDSCNWCTCTNDLAFVTQILDDIEANYCIDQNRVYATGMSNGGMFTHRLGCAMADRFAAIAPVAGTLARGFNCAPPAGETVALMHIHGRQDQYVDVSGAMSSDGYFYTAIDDVTALWASQDAQNCAAAVTPYPTVADGMAGMTCTQHAACATGAEVVSCWWDGAHDWPNSEAVNGNQMIWDFFRKHPKRD